MKSEDSAIQRLKCLCSVILHKSSCICLHECLFSNYCNLTKHKQVDWLEGLGGIGLSLPRLVQREGEGFGDYPPLNPITLGIK